MTHLDPAYCADGPCQKFIHTQEPDMDWVCVCGHDTDWHNYGPSKPGGPCEACAEPPAWVYDLVIELMDQEELHPTLYFTSGAFEGYAKYDWCACIALKKVPRDVAEKAAAIRTYKHNLEVG